MDMELLRVKLEKLYLKEDVEDFLEGLKSLKPKKNIKNKKLTNQDICLITYANSINKTGISPLKALKDFFTLNSLDEIFSITHLLPFYPWDQDRGFSVIDYYKVKKEYGSWEDIESLKEKTDLMFDFVLNHASIENKIVKYSLINNHIPNSHPLKKEVLAYKDFVISYSFDSRPKEEELKFLSRPRDTPVLTPYIVYEDLNNKIFAKLGKEEDFTDIKKIFGTGLVWTTFSRKKTKEGKEATAQVDLNFKNHKVLLESIKILLFYIEKNCNLIRLDAIGYIWKVLNSTSLHESEVYLILDIIEEVLNFLAPSVLTVAEVNEPQDKVFSYLGDDKKKGANLVYQFTHFPLAVYSIYKEDSTYYLNWLKTTFRANKRQFITSYGTHDGVGLKPLRGILPQKEIEDFSNYLVKKRNGLANYAVLPGGKKIIYEVCQTPWGILNHNSKDSLNIQIEKYISVLGLSFLVEGLPAIYINGVFGLEHNAKREELSENREINRELLSFDSLIGSIEDKASKESLVLERIREISLKRANCDFFDFNSKNLEVLELNTKKVIGVKLFNKKEENLLALVNISNKDLSLKIKDQKGKRTDLISKKIYDLKKELLLTPYQTLWLVP